MESLNIESFNPTTAELRQLVEKTKTVIVTDIGSKEQMDIVKENRIMLRDARVKITKMGKELRDGAVKFQKAVIEKEKELVGIIEPEEERLKAIEEEVKIKKLRAERIALLPERKKKLAEIGDGKDYSDKDELFIGMDASEFQAYLNAKVSEKNEAERIENERKAKELKDKEEAIERERVMLEREEKARQEEREKAEQREKDRVEREIREKKEEAEREERRQAFAKEQLEKEEKRIEEEKEKLAKKEKFVEFLKTLGWTEDNKADFMLKYSEVDVKVYKLLGTYKEN